MIAKTVVPGRFWRVLSPRWSKAPLSGEGAARLGGRWNRPDEATLYLSEALGTAVAEYQQEMNVRPGTFVAYDVGECGIVDLTDPRILADLGIKAEDLVAPWKEDAFVRKVDPPTWSLADWLQFQFDGARVPSAQVPGGANLVLWRWNERGGPDVTFLDPMTEL